MEIKIGGTYKLKNRIKTVTKIEGEIVYYNVKDGSGRFEFLDTFERWLNKGAELI